MPVKLYMNHNVPRSIAIGLKTRDVDVVTAYEDGAAELDDSDLLDRALKLDRLLFSQDDDLIIEAANRQRIQKPFFGVVFAHQLHVSIGKIIEDLEIIAKATEPEDVINELTFLPL